jgi:hypothetical protein
VDSLPEIFAWWSAVYQNGSYDGSLGLGFVALAHDVKLFSPRVVLRASRAFPAIRLHKRRVSPGCVNPPVYERRDRKQAFGVLLAHAP